MRERSQQQSKNGRVLWKHAVRRWITAVSVVVVLAGCGTPVVEEDAKVKALTERLNEIETVRLKDRSRSQPISVEQATKEVVEEITEPNEVRPTVELTLAEVRAAALVNNLDLKVELIDPSIGKTYLDEEKAKFESIFFGSTQHRRTEAVGTGTLSTTSSYETGIESPLHTGGSIILSVPFSDAEWGGIDSGGVAEAAASVSYVQSLLRGAGTRVNTNSIRIAQYHKHIVDAQTKLAAIRILANADTAYWRLFAAHRELEVRREQYKLAQGQLEHARGKVAAGAAARIEIVRAEAGLGSRLEELIIAETRLRSRERDLKLIMNRDDMPPHFPATLVTATEPSPLGLDLDEDVMAAAAIANRMETVALELSLAIDEIDIELARNATLPSVTFDYSFAARSRSGTIGSAIEDLADNSFPDHSIGLSAAIPIGSEAAKARLYRARLEQLRNRLTRDQLQLMIRQEVQEAVNELGQNWRRILAAAQGVEAAYRDYRVEQSQFQLGFRTSTEVLYAAARLADAQLRKIWALVEYEIAQINLARATGTLLGYGKIQIEPMSIEDK